MIGMVALFWIVVRNGIILFDKINHNLAENIPFKEAIIDAWMSRLEPVMLTSICTALWMIPLTLSNPIWTSLWLSIICWLTVSTIFTLVVLPSLYFVMFGKKEQAKDLKILQSWPISNL
jgi:multidrug efflux pump subunit AcrB